MAPKGAGALFEEFIRSALLVITLISAAFHGHCAFTQADLQTLVRELY